MKQLGTCHMNSQLGSNCQLSCRVSRMAMAYFEIVTTGDMERIRKILPSDLLEAMNEMGLSDAEVMKYLTLFSPSDVEVVGGTLHSNVACFDIKMVMDGQPSTGIITMERFDGQWISVTRAGSINARYCPLNSNRKPAT